eukprot:445511_1
MMQRHQKISSFLNYLVGSFKEADKDELPPLKQFVIDRMWKANLCSQKDQKPIQTSHTPKEDSPVISDTVNTKTPEQKARNAQLAAMLARLLRDTGKLTIVHFIPYHKRRKLNEKHLEIADQTSPRMTTTPSGRIVIETNEMNRKLYIPPHCLLMDFNDHYKLRK